MTTTRPVPGFVDTRRDAEVWVLFSSGYDWDTNPGAVDLVTTFERRFGERFAVVRSSELVLGVSSGELTLHTLDGVPLAAPRVAYVRTPALRFSLDREVTLFRQLTAMGTTMINSIDAELSCVNKVWQLQQLAVAGLPIPRTHTYIDAPLDQVIDSIAPQPCIVKAVRSVSARRVFLAPDMAMLRDVSGSLRDDRPYLLQRYVASSRGRILRVEVIDGRAVRAYEATSSRDEVKSNVSLGISLRLCLGEYPEGDALAIRAANVLGLAVAGVDLLFDEEGFVICEVNSTIGLHDWTSDLTAAIAEVCAARLEPTPASDRRAGARVTPGSAVGGSAAGAVAR
jgi:RimK family alpha-L-glutamate ligase